TYMEISHESLQQRASGLFLYFLRDDFASKFRKMLIAEQYRNELARLTLQNYFFDSPINFQTKLFKSMIIGGTFRDFDPHIMALHFYSPIFLLLNKYDYNQDNETEALSVLAKHVKQFSEIYCI
ncbi:MAG: TetR/AcrR family transcriptional regulator, partial [Oscillospiraceae bacterium]